MRIIIFASDKFAVPALISLSSNPNYKVLAVVTKPDKPSGRGLHIESTLVKTEALKLNLRVLEPQNLKDDTFKEILSSLSADYFVVIAYGRILPPEVLSIPFKHSIGIHPSLLPAYQGASPIESAILNGEVITGITTYCLDSKCDTGAILMQEEIEIPPDADSGTLREILSQMAYEIIHKTILLFHNGEISPRPQNQESACYAPKIDSINSVIDWQNDCEKISNIIRAFYPKPGAKTTFRGKLIKILKSEKDEYCNNGENLPGTITNISKDKGICVCCLKGCIYISKLQPENKKEMLFSEFMCGYKPLTGERFGV